VSFVQTRLKCQSVFGVLAKCSNNVALRLSTRFCMSFVALAVSLSPASLSWPISSSIWATLMSVTSPVWTAFFNLFSAYLSRESANFSFACCLHFVFFRLSPKDTSCFCLSSRFFCACHLAEAAASSSAFFSFASFSSNFFPSR